MDYRKREEVEVGGLRLVVREMSLAEYDLVNQDNVDGASTAELIASCVETVDGEAFVTKDEAAALPLRMVNPLSDAILRVSGFGGDEDEPGKSETTPSDGSDSS